MPATEIGHCETGHAVAAEGFSLAASYVIHTVGPVWHGGIFGEAELLYSAYNQSLMLAKKRTLSSIAFPLISLGIYGYPKEQALHIAVSAITNFLQENDMLVYLRLFR